MAGKQISLTAMGSYTVTMVCEQLGVDVFSFASTEYKSGDSKALQTMGVCNGAVLNVGSLRNELPRQVTMQSQLKVMQYLCSLTCLL